MSCKAKVLFNLFTGWYIIRCDLLVLLPIAIRMIITLSSVEEGVVYGCRPGVVFNIVDGTHLITKTGPASPLSMNR